MTAVKAGDVEGLIRRGPDPRVPVILIYGPDTGLVADRAARLIARIVPDPDDPFALIRLAKVLAEQIKTRIASVLAVKPNS